MRPIERKILGKITDKGVTLDQIEEMLDRIDRTEKKKSFPDESHFQSDRYFARLIVDSLLRQRKLRREGDRLLRPDLEEKKKAED